MASRRRSPRESLGLSGATYSAYDCMMYQPLAPCPACSRHIKTTERSCPFCKGAIPESIAESALPGATSRLSRAAAFAFTASLAVTGAAAAVSGCSSGSTLTTGDASADGSTDGGPNDDGSPGALYGAVAVDAGPDDAGGAGTKYGGPPIDSGSD